VTSPRHPFGSFSPRTRDRARLALLILVAVEVFVLPSLFAAGVLSSVQIGATTSLTLAAGVIAVGGGVAVTVFTASCSVITFVTKMIALSYPSKLTLFIDSALTMGIVCVFVGLIFAYVFGKERSTLHRMVGAIAAYLLIAVIWARAYYLLSLVRPNALNLGEEHVSYDALVYFSFATLTTLGYGTPIGPFARALVAMEALVGQLYPAILIARLVSLPSATKSSPPVR
jgi:hypothetical protein